MSNTFKLTAIHGNMFTFERSVNGKPTDYLRGFGASEKEALDNARSELVGDDGMLLYRDPEAKPWINAVQCLTY